MMLVLIFAVAALYAFPYVLLLLTLLRSRGRSIAMDVMGSTPSVSIVIATYNEANKIDRKIENILALDYPREKMDIIVVDSSDDETPDRIRRWEKSFSFIRLIKEPRRRGLATALNLGYAAASGEIAVKSDCDILHPPDALRKLVAPFSDSQIGGVSGRQILSSPHSTEMGYRTTVDKIREIQSKLDSAYMFEPFCAFRKELIEPISETSVADDGELALRIRKKGFRTVFVSDAHFYEKTPTSMVNRLRQKSRRGQGHIQLVLTNLKILFNSKYGSFGLIVFPTMFFLMVVNPWLLPLLGVGILHFLSELIGVSFLLLTILAVTFLGVSYLAGLPKLLSGFLESQISLLLGGLNLLLRGPSYIWDKTD
ncbi:MAG: glycosyltransferase [Candidatus Bathyarchaeota archaeon]|nr:MAG: glycosyltransferase [Candidatus Bathyarchaeota archaeon]